MASSPQFCIVEFSELNPVSSELVSSNWFVEGTDEKYLSFPKSYNINKVVKHEKPKDSWTTYVVKCLYKTANLEKAKAKRQQSLTLSDLGTSSSAISDTDLEGILDSSTPKPSKRPIRSKTKPKRLLEEESDEGDYSSNSSISDVEEPPNKRTKVQSNLVPPPAIPLDNVPVKKFGNNLAAATSPSATAVRTVNTDAVMQNSQVDNHQTTQPFENEPGNNNTFDSNIGFDEQNARVQLREGRQKYLFPDANAWQVKMTEMMLKLQEDVKEMRNKDLHGIKSLLKAMGGEKNASADILNLLPVNLPVNSKENLQELESHLSGNRLHLTMLATYLSKASNTESIHHCVYSTMQEVMTDQLASMFNYAGTNRQKKDALNAISNVEKKEGLKNKKYICAAITRAVRQNFDVANKVVKETMMLWLKHAPQRVRNSKRVQPDDEVPN